MLPESCHCEKGKKSGRHSPEMPSGGGVSMPRGYPSLIEDLGRYMSIAPNMPDWSRVRIQGPRGG